MRRVLEPGETATPIVKEMGHSQECSACGGQYPEKRYFDFDAAHDSGFYGQGGQEDMRITKDDLVLCESCGLEMADKMGWTNNVELQAVLRVEQDRANEAERSEARQAKYAKELERLISQERPKPIKVDHRMRPRKPTTGAAA